MHVVSSYLCNIVHMTLIIFLCLHFSENIHLNINSLSPPTYTVNTFMCEKSKQNNSSFSFETTLNKYFWITFSLLLIVSCFRTYTCGQSTINVYRFEGAIFGVLWLLSYPIATKFMFFEFFKTSWTFLDAHIFILFLPCGTGNFNYSARRDTISIPVLASWQPWSAWVTWQC